MASYRAEHTSARAGATSKYSRRDFAHGITQDLFTSTIGNSSRSRWLYETSGIGRRFSLCCVALLLLFLSLFFRFAAVARLRCCCCASAMLLLCFCYRFCHCAATAAAVLVLRSAWFCLRVLMLRHIYLVLLLLSKLLAAL